jgi:hypothetical protein
MRRNPVPTSIEPKAWTPWAPNEAHGPLAQLRGAKARLRPYRIPAQSCTFQTDVGGDLRTCGVVIGRPGNSALNLNGLDLDLLAVAAAGVPEAAARGKLVVLGEDGVAVFQTKPNVEPELAWCGNGTASVPLFLGCPRAAFHLSGPGGKGVRVVQTLIGGSVKQVWTLRAFGIVEADWLDCLVARCDGLNPYAVVRGPLPDGVAPEEARRALVGTGLNTKLVVVSPSATGAPHVAFHNAHGLHGAAPTTGVATLAILGRLSARFGALLAGGSVKYDTKVGRIEVPLPDIQIENAGAISVMMPAVEIRLLPFSEGGRL